MIGNEQQYRITQAAIERLEEGLAHAEDRRAERHPLAQQLIRDAIEGELATLRGQLADYEARQRDQGVVVPLDSLARLPDLLRRARVAAGLTQRALAERLGIEEDRVWQDEETRYAGASFEHLRAVAEAVGLRIEVRATLPEPIPTGA